MTYTQITQQERYALMLLRRQGLSIRAIAKQVQRAPSTISRELRRNRWRCDPRF
ncbi:MAG: helix-turn-helix domain-containing protein [Gemmatimonadaceae bacterium]